MYFHFKFLKVTKLEFITKCACKINKKCKIMNFLVFYILKIDPIAIQPQDRDPD
jgi:hypothetical protein